MKNNTEKNIDSIDIGKRLPSAFLERMKAQLGDQYEAFVESYGRERTYGLRYNPLKIERERFLKEVPFALREVPWVEEGFYYEAADQPGRHALHEAGAYYIQEPSAMAVTAILDPKPGERILDLCAAPGGKSTHIAGRMQGKGLLVSNEVVPSRAGILSQNIERMGIANCVVCREKPERLAKVFPDFFDKVLVDAPCSGEGMFRKDETAIEEWSPENVDMCASRQRDILEQAAGMVCAGGVIVYSTCTFSTKENEEVIEDFVTMHPDYVIEETIINGIPAPDKTIRLWPHRIEGEGHFIARLRRTGGVHRAAYRTVAEEGTHGQKRAKGKDKIPDELCESFLCNELGLTKDGRENLFKERVLYNFGDAVYLIPGQMIPLEGLQIERPGLQLGFAEKNRFKPSHALALALRPEYVHNNYRMTPEQISCYLRGETFAVDSALKGWYLLTVQGCSVGFGKATGGQMKNHYPKGLRKQVM